jgi:hypothetical protein
MSEFPSLLLLQQRLPWRRRLRRLLVRLRTWPWLVPAFLLGFWLLVMVGLSRVADIWIVLLAATPLLFALVLALGCLWAYRRDFYA